MSDFDKALKFVLEHECVYRKGHWGDMDFVRSENQSKDPGGLTKYGIDQRSHPNVDIENLTEEHAAEIYRKEYWERHHCNELDWPLSAVHFDNCINMGAGQGVKLLQRECGSHADGAWGPNTRIAMQSACKVRGAKAVAMGIIKRKRQFYKDLAAEDPDQYGGFEEGWLNRTRDLEEFIA